MALFSRNRSISISVLRVLSTVLLLAGALAGCERPTREGAVAEEPEAAPVASAIVTYGFDVHAPADALSPATLLVAELARHPNLGRLTVSDDSAPEGPPTRTLEAEFAFGTAAAYLEWREQAGTRALLDGLAALATEPSDFQATLSVRRPSLYRSIVGRVGTGSGGEGREVESVACNADCSQIDVKYKTRANEAGGGGGGSGQGTGDAGDIDAVTLVCKPGLAGTIENCRASN